MSLQPTPDEICRAHRTLARSSANCARNFSAPHMLGADLWSRIADEGTAPVRRIAVTQRRGRR